VSDVSEGKVRMTKDKIPCIIDAHTHLGLESFIVRPIPKEKLKRPAFQDRMELRVEDLVDRMDRNDVAQAVAFPFPLEEIDADAGNRYVLEAAKAHPDRIIPFALIEEEIEPWLAFGARGFKQHAGLQSPERFDLTTAYRTMAEAGVPLIIHLQGAIHGTHPIDQVKAILRVAPTLKVIVAHMARAVPNTGTGVEETALGLRDHRNVYLETSTVRDSETIAWTASIIGAERIIYGSDAPFNSHAEADPMATEINVIRRAGLNQEMMEGICGRNLRRCLA